MIHSQTSSPIKLRKIWKRNAGGQIFTSGYSLKKLIGNPEITDTPTYTTNLQRFQFITAQKPTQLTIIPILPSINKTVKLTKRSNKDTKLIQDCIRKLPHILCCSEDLVKRVNKAIEDYDPKSFKINIGNIINKQKIRVGSHIKYDPNQEENTKNGDKKWRIKLNHPLLEGLGVQENKSILSTSSLIQKLSDSMVENREDISKLKSIDRESTHKISAIKRERGKLLSLLQVASDSKANKFISSLKKSDYQQVLDELKSNPSYSSMQFLFKQTALHIAARKGNDNIIKLLLDNGADKRIKDAV